MPTRKTRYTRLETDPETDSDDEAPPAQVQLHSSQYIKGQFVLACTNRLTSYIYIVYL